MLLKVDFHAGHGGASEKSKSMKEQASRAQRVELGAESGERSEPGLGWHASSDIQESQTRESVAPLTVLPSLIKPSRSKP